MIPRRRPGRPGLWDVGGPVAIAHRGVTCGGARENSMAAFAAARELGYRYVETDVRASADGVAVLHHDPVLVTGSAVADLTWEQLHALGVARLDDLLTTWPDLRVNLDVKDAAGITPLARSVVAAGAGERVCIASFSDVRRRAALAQLARAGVHPASSPGRVGIVAFLAAARLGVRGPALARLVRVLRATCLQVPERAGSIRVLTPATLAAARSAHLAVHVWTIDDAPTMTRLLDAGVDGLITDAADVLREVLSARGAWPSPLAGQ